jgi:hypothetical protein
MKLQRQATGKDLIPNSSFWGSVPGNIKVGTFSMSNVMVFNSTFNNISVIS